MVGQQVADAHGLVRMVYPCQSLRHSACARFLRVKSIGQYPRGLRLLQRVYGLAKGFKRQVLLSGGVC